VAELVDAPDSKSGVGDNVVVRVPSRVHFCSVLQAIFLQTQTSTLTVLSKPQNFPHFILGTHRGHTVVLAHQIKIYVNTLNPVREVLYFGIKCLQHPTNHIS
jgi:hypothetical protein